MSRTASRLFLALILLMLGSATCAYSGAGPIDPAVRQTGQDWSRPLRFIADCLTLPIPTTDMADIRDVVLLVAAGTAILFLSYPFKKSHALFRLDRNMARLCVLVFLLALLSAFDNHRFELSRGWIIRFAAGAIWAGLLATHLTPDRARTLVRLVLSLAGMTLILTIVHRTERGLAHFTWPIGPITITAAIAGLWATIAVVWLVVHLRRPDARADVALSATVAAIGLYCLWETGRRSAALGLVAGLVAAGSAHFWIVSKTRRARSTIICGALILTIAAIGYVVNQATSTTREKSGPVALRLAYWRESVALIRANPLPGVGPDCFIVDMTNRVAPLRAVSPQFYHGSVDPYAHNEWLQALVELGIPAGLAYLAIPILALLAAKGAVRNAAGRHVSLAALAGLATICVNELASINLRESIMPIWYWTLLGMCLIGCERHPPKESSARQSLTRLGFALLGFLLLAFAGIEVNASLASREVSAPPARLIARKSLEALGDRAFRAQMAARLDKSVSPALARSLWAKFYELAPGAPNVSAMYADCLIQEGRKEDAARVLHEALGPRWDPFDPAANHLYASILTDPLERFRCVQRASRSTALDGPLREILTQVAGSPTVQAALSVESPIARALASSAESDQFADATVELLRLNVFLKTQTSSFAEALSDQRLVADCYRRLEQTDSRYRRKSEAEVDAFYTLARLIYEHDRAQYRLAYDAIRHAERYAVLGIGHESVARPQPQRGFLIGEVMPTEFPARLRPMWRLSALLQIVTGNDLDLDYRVFFSLPPEDWTQPSLHRELARLAREAYQGLAALPEPARPAHFALLPDMIRRYDAMAAGPGAPPTN